jgi:hypothetical protein
VSSAACRKLIGCTFGTLHCELDASASQPGENQLIRATLAKSGRAREMYVTYTAVATRLSPLGFGTGRRRPSPRAPSGVRVGNVAIVGGTGAFLGVRGQVGQGVTLLLVLTSAFLVRRVRVAHKRVHRLEQQCRQH